MLTLPCVSEKQWALSLGTGTTSSDSLPSFMQNPAIKTLKAIREIHNESHQQQVHTGGWLTEMTQTTLLHDSLGACCPLVASPMPPFWCRWVLKQFWVSEAGPCSEFLSL